MATGSSSRVNAPPDSLVCVIDDDERTRHSLRQLFISAGLAVRTFPSAEAFLRADLVHEPCCLVVDVEMPGMDGFELQERVADRGEQIIFLTDHCDVRQCAKAMRAGAVDFLTKPVDRAILLASVGSALAESSRSRCAAEHIKAARARLESLTAREMEVMQHVISGMLNKQIAARLGAAEKTIKIHRGRVMAKMRVPSVADLVRLAQALGILPANAEEFAWMAHSLPQMTVRIAA